MNQAPGQPAGRFDWYTLYTVWLSYPLEKEGERHERADDGTGMAQAGGARQTASVCLLGRAVCAAREKTQKLREDRSFSVFLLLLSLSAALVMPVLTPRTLRQQYPEATTAESPEGVQARAVSSVSYELPEGLVTNPLPIPMNGCCWEG